ncbi:uncharacterized protein C1orf141 homolog [Talpa occidentalis]|uniref:uncharacterized protein C1orf141 homolog n=1 Tax=Talpa occidentalis TaxID=50954 RepID=UPI0023F69D39|nr:uncharacterized protein C1orf141 homolog [Talpa occidentalis]XP_054547802.1 uncharacterized protein C1orf141 homolog [Talpa occidentalis]XP_054547803.1 uncharacterized protein C1orf141 homolog [Talpa occidentalis]XP_054547804.1 uncharacterized protein C1orf141 homolog [Talpa occidentalis]XP_054547805.1 uncharacterized protein C1orf141 homolog [Talpa occidentalis]
MAEQILAKLDVLDKQAMLLSARRIKENMLQCQLKKKTSAIPLTFDFHLDFEETIDTPTFMTVPKITKDKLCGTDMTKRHVSFKTKPEPRKISFEKLDLRPHARPTDVKSQEAKSKDPEKENLKPRSTRSLYFLKDISEVEYAKPLHNLYSQHSQTRRRKLSSTIFSPVPSNESKVYKKEKDSILFAAQTERKTSESLDLVDHLEDYENKRRESLPQMNDYSAEETKYIKSDQLSNDSSVKMKNLLPLCFEDELKKPNAKIIDISPAKTETSHMEQHDTNPIIFHETEYIKMLLLTKDRLPPYLIQDRNIYPYKRTNLMLERNHEFLKSLINAQSITPSKFKRTASKARENDIPETTSEMDKLRKKTIKWTVEKIPWNKLNNFSQTFSSLRKKFLGFLDKTVIQEMDTQTDKPKRMFSTVKPINAYKFSASPVKYYSKPIKNIMKVQVLSNVTPLDNLLKLPSEN